MQHTSRCSLFPIENRQDIAQHSHGVSMLCLLVGNEISEHFRLTGTPLFLNVNKAVVMAVTHDYDETISMDFPLPFKNKLGKDLMEQINSVIEKESIKDFSDIGLSLDSIKKEKSDVTAEYQLLKVCDYLELLIWVYNNKHKVKGDFHTVINTCKELIRTYPLYQYSKTTQQLLSSEPFEFSYQ